MRLVVIEQKEGVYWRLSGEISHRRGQGIGLNGQVVAQLAVKSCSPFRSEQFMRGMTCGGREDQVVSDFD